MVNLRLIFDNFIKTKQLIFNNERKKIVEKSWVFTIFFIQALQNLKQFENIVFYYKKREKTNNNVMQSFLTASYEIYTAFV